MGDRGGTARGAGSVGLSRLHGMTRTDLSTDTAEDVLLEVRRILKVPEGASITLHAEHIMSWLSTAAWALKL